MEHILDVLKEKRTIEQFSKKGNKLVHPFSPNGTPEGSKTIEISLYTLGHLWIYLLLENYGYREYLREILNYAIENKIALFEWEIDEQITNDLKSILEKYNITFSKYLGEDFRVSDYDEIDKKSKDKDEALMRLTRFLVMAELGTTEQIYDKSKDLKVFFEDEGTIINATYLFITITGQEKLIIDKVPDWFKSIIFKNMSCYYEDYEMRYYPRMNILMSFLSGYEEIFEENWYLISDDEQVIISKFLYSIQIFKELSTSLLGLNGILSAVSTRIMFDNYWQSLYLIKNNKIADYRDFVLKRIRLHILKRDDGTDVNVGELLREVKDGIFDPIPVNGDYFTKSAREYAIELGIKDNYDKYYEFNSEFIHSSLTAVYSGIMIPCKNPEHDGHLMVKSGGARLVESIPGIIEIVNKHIKLVNQYLQEDLLPEMKLEDFFQSRSEWIEEMKSKGN